MAISKTEYLILFMDLTAEACARRERRASRALVDTRAS